MRFLSLLIAVMAAFPFVLRLSAGTPDCAVDAALEDARERHRRAELLAIGKELREIYAEFEHSEIPDLERSRRLAPIAARYENMLLQFPEDAETLVLYAKFLRDGGDDAGARELFEKALKIEPGWAVIYQQLAAIAAEQGDAVKALPLMRKAVEAEPGQAVYQVQLGELIAAFREKLLAGKVFETREELDFAMQNAFRAARSLMPRSLPAAMRYAESFYDVENPDWRAALDAWNVAEKIFEVFVKEGTNPAEQILMLESLELHRARACAELGRFDEAEKILGSVADERLIYSRENIRKIIFEKRKLFNNKEQSL